jgi:BolA protein
MNPSKTRATLIEEALKTALNPTHLVLQDESALHAGHRGAAGGGHFALNIVSAAFHGKSLVQRHRMVYEAIGKLMETEIHALSITAKTPTEVT